MPKAAGKEHLQHRLHAGAAPLRRPRFTSVYGEQVNFEFDRQGIELRISEPGRQQFIWGEDLTALKNLLQQEMKPQETRRGNHALRRPLRQRSQPIDTEERIKRQEVEHLEAMERQKDLPVSYDL